jgi:hypothetical protein
MGRDTAGSRTRPFDARAFVQSQAQHARPGQATVWRTGVAIACALSVSLSLGTFVVAAQEDVGIYDIVRQNAREARRQVEAIPAVFHARSASNVVSYAPLGVIPFDVGRLDRRGFFPTSAPPRPAQAKAPRSARPTPAAVAGGRTHYCVRTCDGFFFPISLADGSESAAQATCQAFCPASETRLYVSRNADIEKARALDGKSYTAQKTAFSHRSTLNESCSCTGAGPGLASVPVMKDPTLRAGDVIVTNAGLQVFAGNGTGPHRTRDFASLRSSDQLSAAAKQRLAQIDQALKRHGSGAAPIVAVSAQRAERRANATRLPERADRRPRPSEPAQQANALRLVAAEAGLIPDDTVVRYVGPVRSGQ